MSIWTQNIAKFHQKNSKRLFKNLQNTTGDYFFAAPYSMNYEQLVILTINILWH